MAVNSLISCTYLSDFKTYESKLNISHNKLHTKAKIIGSNNDSIIVNNGYILTRYFDIFKERAKTVTLSEMDYMKYRFQPKKYCYEKLGSIELWSLLLRLNNMSSIAQFDVRTFKVPPADVNNIINEILILEKNYIDENKESIEY